MLHQTASAVRRCGRGTGVPAPRAGVANYRYLSHEKKICGRPRPLKWQKMVGFVMPEKKMRPACGNGTKWHGLARQEKNHAGPSRRSRIEVAQNVRFRKKSLGNSARCPECSKAAGRSASLRFGLHQTPPMPSVHVKSGDFKPTNARAPRERSILKSRAYPIATYVLKYM